MNIGSIIFHLVFFGIWVFFAVAPSLQSKALPVPARLLSVVASFLLVVGAIGFSIPFFASDGGLNWLPESCEWPVGHADGVVSMKNGLHIVPQRNVYRIHVYDSDWAFIRSWPINAYGGSFKIRAADDESIEVVTARGDRRYVFNIDGELLSDDPYEGDYSSFPDSENSVTILPALWLWVFADSFNAWFVLGAGVLVMLLASAVAGAMIIASELAGKIRNNANHDEHDKIADTGDP